MKPLTAKQIHARKENGDIYRLEAIRSCVRGLVFMSNAGKEKITAIAEGALLMIRDQQKARKKVKQ